MNARFWFLNKLLIVAVATLGVSENCIGFIDLPEFFRSFCLLAGCGKEIRMMPFNALSISRFNFIGARGAPNTENVIEVRLTHESIEIQSGFQPSIRFDLAISLITYWILYNIQ